MEPEKDQHQIMNELLTENQRLLKENNELLQKMTWRSRWGLVIRILWLFILLGVPVALYYYIIEPYFSSVSDALINLNTGLQAVPGWTQFVEAISIGRGE